MFHLLITIILQALHFTQWMHRWAELDTQECVQYKFARNFWEKWVVWINKQQNTPRSFFLPHQLLPRVLVYVDISLCWRLTSAVTSDPELPLTIMVRLCTLNMDYQLWSTGCSLSGRYDILVFLNNAILDTIMVNTIHENFSFNGPFFSW